MLSNVSAKEDKKQSRSYKVVLLVAGDKIAYLQQDITPIPASDWDNSEKFIRGMALPTATREIGHCVQVFCSSIGEDTRIYFGPVDTWSDLSLSLGDTITQLKDKSWEKCELDSTLQQMRDAYFRKIFPVR